jgi:hypothetical protein
MIEMTVCPSGSPDRQRFSRAVPLPTLSAYSLPAQPQNQQFLVRRQMLASQRHLRSRSFTYQSDLVYHPDVVISASGTMNREAAILGTRVYTIFAGDLPAVERRLVELGRLSSFRSTCDRGTEGSTGVHFPVRSCVSGAIGW